MARLSRHAMTNPTRSRPRLRMPPLPPPRPPRDQCPIVAISCLIVQIRPHPLRAACTRAPGGS
ncbi:hypothetical protein P355_1686 [Burkholderia cenocepacia KC-01]|nr:hypothetical protein P355_1686 [Burkholderia cenocepacia KC-01]